MESRDTDTTDSNAFDLITGSVSQATVMEWTKGLAVAPYVRLDTADSVIDAVFTVTSEKVKKNQVLAITATNNGDTPLTLTARTIIGPIKLVSPWESSPRRSALVFRWCRVARASASRRRRPACRVSR